ncbi:MAG: hypothetical protein E7293_08420 [Lachnospiraceae bacterium]|nr:hypothetical protein [Lachnospiraceae bacterium]
MNVVQQMQLKNAVERVLHVPGNYTEAIKHTGQVLEMALVLDYHISEPELRMLSTEIVDLLKRHSEVFRNVRLNVIKWVDDTCICKEVSSMAHVRMGQIFGDYVQGSSRKSFLELARQLKLFYARSKLILVLTDGSFYPGEPEKVREQMHPFLHRKLLILQNGKVCIGTEWMREILT